MSPSSMRMYFGSLYSNWLSRISWLGPRIRELGDGRAPGFGRDRRQQVHVRFTVAELDAPGDDALFLVTIHSTECPSGAKSA